MMRLQIRDIEALKRTAASGCIGDIESAELYWFHAIAAKDAAFYQSDKAHRHTFFELHFILDGAITYVSEGEQIPLVRGEWLMFAPGQVHSISSYTSSLVKCSVAFTIPENQPIYAALISKCGEKTNICTDIEDCLHFIASIGESKSPYTNTLIKNRVFELIHSVADVMTVSSKDVAATVDGTDVRVFKVKQFVRDNPNVFFNCGYLASYCGISEKQLGRLFLRYEGMSLLSFLHSEKISFAKRILSQTDMTLSEISDDLGFSNVYYFSRFFKSHTGLTPGEFRINERAKNAVCSSAVDFK